VIQKSRTVKLSLPAAWESSTIGTVTVWEPPCPFAKVTVW
jgi:hypothetical protein